MEENRIEIGTGDDGQRLVTWRETDASGSIIAVRHDFPDTERHLYPSAGCNVDVPLYRGELTDSEGYPCHKADVSWRWVPTPRVEVRGSRPARRSDFANMVKKSQRWIDTPTVAVELPEGQIPQPPADGEAPEAGSGGRSFVQQLQQELGPADDALDRVTFLVPNGWNGSDGHGICDPEDLQRTWRGRLVAVGDGWRVTIDQSLDMTTSAWRELRDSAGHRFTHIGCLTREDGTTFTGSQAFYVLDRVRLGLEIALGRRLGCVLPVGWTGSKPVWCRWNSGPIDTYRALGSGVHWLDESVVHKQISDLLALVLDFTSDETNLSVLRAARFYHVTGNAGGADVQLSVSIPVSALQMLAYYRFVVQLKTHSRSAWEDPKQFNTESQIRCLLKDIKIDLAIQPYFQYLDAVRSRLALTSKERDALGVVVKMRNVVTHPTRDRPDTYSAYEWAEASMHARYWLCLALLHLVGYQGEIAETMAESPPWQGQVCQPPWAT